MSIPRRLIGAAVAVAVSACMPGMGGPREIDTTPLPALLRGPNPLLGITQTYDQHMAIDSIRTMYRAQIKDMGRVTRVNHDDMDNLVRREIVDLRSVLTPEQQAIFDRHVAAALAGPQAPSGEPIDH